MDAEGEREIAIPGYDGIEQLYCGAKTVVYRARQQKDGKPVTLKLLKSEYPTFNEILQFRHQYTIAKHLDLVGVLRPYALEPYRNSYAIVMENFDGILLRQYVQTESLSLEDVLAIALQMCDILHGFYVNRIVHKDIKPDNILIQPESKQIELIDCCLASLLPQETQDIPHPNVLAGSLAYFSPEQTGRMNRGIDHRSDLYSLGVTLYELLAARLPFETENSRELVHCHIAKQALPVCQLKSDIPSGLGAIVVKLMAKNAEDRYQTALGLKHDLDVCCHQLNTTGTIEPFALGKRDVSDRFLISEKLYGREAEVWQLLEMFERVAKGSAELVLLTGFSGIGKTAVVNEVHKPIVRQQGYFIKGKFDRFQRNIPFSAFVEAFRDLMGQLLGESDAQLQQWQTKILNALGDKAQVIVEVIPELEKIIGQQPSPPKLLGTEAQNRFNLLFQNFIEVFTKAEHPLVIFLDDLQWADAASLKLLELSMVEANRGYFLAIATCRDNEVSPTHPAILTFNEIAQAGVPSHRIAIKSLDRRHLNQLVADTLSCPSALAHPLSELIYQKTQGNPFFATQFLKALYREALIVFDPQIGHWQCDIAKIREASLTDDVLALMTRQLQKLPLPTQQVLQLAACLGNEFDLTTLALVSEQTNIETAAALWVALQEGQIVPQSEMHKFSLDLDSLSADASPLTPNFKFLHDRVRQAAYALIPQAQKPSTHLKIGRRLLERVTEEELAEKIFEIVNQLNYGIELISQPQERKQLVRLNLIAGRRAKATVAYAAALEYFKVAVRLLSDRSWQIDYALTLAFYEEAIEAAYLGGDFRQLDRWTEILLSHTATILDRIKTYRVQIAARVSQNQLREAIDLALSVLAQLDIHFPQHPTSSDWQKAIEEVTQTLGNRAVASAIDLPLMEDPRSQAALEILLGIDVANYICFPDLLPLTVCEEVNLSLRFGNAVGSAKAYANYGLILCAGLGDPEIGYQFGQLALQVLEKLGAKKTFAQPSFLVNFFILHWKEPLRHTLKPLQEDYQIALEAGDLTHAAIALEKYCCHAYWAGEALPQLAADMETYAQKMVQLKQDIALHTHQIHWQSVLNTIGEVENPCRPIGRACDETTLLPLCLENNNRTALYYLYFNKLFLCYLFNDYDWSLENAELTGQYLDGASAQFISTLFYFYDSLARLAVYFKAAREEREKILAIVATNQQKIFRWANYAPSNFQHKYELVEAERHRVLGEKSEAIEAYEKAIRLARIHEYLQEAAIANELAARFYLDWGKDKFARLYMQDAYDCYQCWGAKAKIRQIEALYPHLLTAIARSPDSQTDSLSVRGDAFSDSLDLKAILEASQTISRAIQHQELLSNLLQVVVENAGADRGCLLLKSPEGIESLAEWHDGTVTILDRELPQLRELLPLSMIHRVQHTLEAAIVNDLKRDTTFIADPYFNARFPKSLLCLPILDRGKAIALLYLENYLAIDAFTRDRLEVLHLLAVQVAISLNNARLYQQLQDYSHTLEQRVAERTLALEKANRKLHRLAMFDDLTWLSNRRRFDEYLQQQWQRMRRERQPLSLILCDVDFFKLYNDCYGHQAGDRCLQLVAKAISRGTKRPGDLVARYGGEEFGVILPNTPVEGAIKVASSICRQVPQLQIPHTKSLINAYVTLSAGISTIVPDAEGSPESAIAMADRALYRAKTEGRNRYAVYRATD